MIEHGKHRVEKAEILRLPPHERMEEIKSFLWSQLHDTCWFLNLMGVPTCRMVDFLQQNDACGAFDPCMVCGMQKTSHPTSESS